RRRDQHPLHPVGGGERGAGAGVDVRGGERRRRLAGELELPAAAGALQPGRSCAPRQRGEQRLRPEVLMDVDAAHSELHNIDRISRLQSGPRSTITDVAFTAAVAGTPGASPSSSTESRVTAAVNRNGPASISTSAITPSTSTDRTMPGKRLPADS